jgi:hypothetical protein
VVLVSSNASFSHIHYRDRTHYEKEQATDYAHAYRHQLNVCEAVQAHLPNCYSCHINEKEDADPDPFEGIATSHWKQMKVSLHIFSLLAR